MQKFESEKFDNWLKITGCENTVLFAMLMVRTSSGE